MNLLNAFEGAAFTAEIGVFGWPKAAADGAAGNATAETAIGVVGPGPVNIAIGQVNIHPSAALTADNSNFATITVAKRTAGGGAVTIATATTKTAGGGGTGNWVAWTPLVIPASAGASLAPGDAITVTIAKSGTGVVVPQLWLAGFPATE